MAPNWWCENTVVTLSYSIQYSKSQLDEAVSLSETESESHPAVPLMSLSLTNWWVHRGVNAGDLAVQRIYRDSLSFS
jgi:hypothetical protein